MRDRRCDFAGALYSRRTSRFAGRAGTVDAYVGAPGIRLAQQSHALAQCLILPNCLLHDDALCHAAFMHRVVSFAMRYAAAAHVWRPEGAFSRAKAGATRRSACRCDIEPHAWILRHIMGCRLRIGRVRAEQMRRRYARDGGQCLLLRFVLRHRKLVPGRFHITMKAICYDVTARTATSFTTTTFALLPISNVSLYSNAKAKPIGFCHFCFSLSAPRMLAHIACLPI